MLTIMPLLYALIGVHLRGTAHFAHRDTNKTVVKRPSYRICGTGNAVGQQCAFFSVIQIELRASPERTVFCGRLTRCGTLRAMAYKLTHSERLLSRSASAT